MVGWQRTAGVAWALLATTTDLLRSRVCAGGCVLTCGLVVLLLLLLQTHEGDMRLVSVYVPTNHVYVGECACWQAQRCIAVLYCEVGVPDGRVCLNAAGDIFLLDERDIIHTNLSVREGLGECLLG